MDWLHVALEGALTKIETRAAEAGAVALHATVDGRYLPCDWAWWTSGFWAGALLLAHRLTGNAQLLQLSEAAECHLAATVSDERVYRLHHDVGFQFLPTAVARYRLTGDPVARRRGYLAAALLAGRFNPASGVIEAWNVPERRGCAIVDTLMNLPLLYWAAAEFDLPRYRHIADAHARSAMTHWQREDGSMRHIVRFDPSTGRRVEALAGQGQSPESAWSRGQAWALYGFTAAYEHTGCEAYLGAAHRVAEFILGSRRDDAACGAPPWDYRATAASASVKDSSAGAITALGLLALAQRMPGDPRSERYRDAAVGMLRALAESCAAWDAPESDGILLHATGHFPAGRDVDVSLIYGDFFWVEALAKLAGFTDSCWLSSSSDSEPKPN